MGDYNRDTAHLSLSEHGAYRVLLDTYYATAKPLPASPDALYRLAKAMTPAERKAVDLVALQFFPVGGDGLRRNVRADREIAKHKNQAEINREIGKRGGRPIGSVKITESVIESVSESVSKSVPKMEPANNPNQKPETRENLKPEIPIAAAIPDAGPIWSECLAILRDQGNSESSARSFLGLSLREYTEPQVAEAVKASIGKANALAYVRAVLKASPKKTDNTTKRVAI
jgi:uncharacterized protein YdaU (DUF1376 family)